MSQETWAKVDEDLLTRLDAVVSPNAKVDEKAFKYLFDIFAESLSYVTEPDPDDEDEHGPWSDSTMKHRVFDYWPTTRPGKRLPHNDLAWVLADFAAQDEESKKYVEEELKKYVK